MVNNYGALFLAYALERKITELGYDVETISWLPDEVRHPWKLSMIRKTGIFHYFMRLGYFSVFVLPRQFSFRRFRKQMNTSIEKYVDSTLPMIADRYDKILIGGDQLWNCKVNYYNENNFLPFIHEKSRKLVYAASLAQDNMRAGFEKEFGRLASGFGYITTRETRGKEIIEELTGLPAPRVADPAFLLTAEEWSILAEEDKDAKKKKYVFVYQVQSDKSVVRLAEKLSKENDLEIIYCPFPLRKHVKSVCKPYMSPEKWLYCMKNAEFVVTDAFHGLVFSLIFNKQFAVEISDYGKDTHSRITSLLKLLHLEDRLFSEDIEADLSKKIDFDKVNEFINKDRDDSIKHIHAMMNTNG